MILSLSNVSKTYRVAGREVTAMRNVSMGLDAGDFAAVMGPSGCGKTTLLLTCGTLLSPDSGTLTIQDTNPYSLAPNRRAAFRSAAIGFLFQQFHLVPYLTAEDNILLAAVNLDKTEARRRAASLMERFGIAQRAHHVPPQLSIGERQRVGLARSLLHSPPIILADEPTGNLDEASAKLALQALAEHAREGGAVLMVTHDSRAASMASRVLHMKDGALLS